MDRHRPGDIQQESDLQWVICGPAEDGDGLRHTLFLHAEVCRLEILHQAAAPVGHGGLQQHQAHLHLLVGHLGQLRRIHHGPVRCRSGMGQQTPACRQCRQQRQHQGDTGAATGTLRHGQAPGARQPQPLRGGSPAAGGGQP